MPIVMTRSKSAWGKGGDDGYVYTGTISFPPAYVHGTVAMTESLGDGGHFVGISGFTHRPKPDGAEQAVNFGWVSDWKSYLGGHERTTSVSWGLFAAPDCRTRGRLDLFWWG